MSSELILNDDINVYHSSKKLVGAIACNYVLKNNSSLSLGINIQIRLVHNWNLPGETFATFTQFNRNNVLAGESVYERFTYFFTDADIAQIMNILNADNQSKFRIVCEITGGTSNDRNNFIKDSNPGAVEVSVFPFIM